MLYHLDLVLFHAVNAWCGNWALDRIVFYEQGNQLLEGGVLLTCYWWFWFAVPEDRRQQNRRQIIAALIGVFLALVVSRVLAAALPFRMRPMYVTGIGYHPPSMQMPMNMENWSSFPSDTAAYFLGLAYGIYRLSRRAGVALMIYATVWILLPRVYLGIHYPSDIVAGAIIGFAAVGASVSLLGRDTPLAKRIIPPIIAAEARRPRVFYAAAFVISFEMTMTFDDVRDFIRASLHGVRMAGYASLDEETILLSLIGLLVAGGAAAWFAWLAMQRHQQTGRHRNTQRPAVRVVAPKRDTIVRS